MSYVGEQGVKGPTTAKERVEFEKAELEERLDKLNAFINEIGRASCRERVSSAG